MQLVYRVLSDLPDPLARPVTPATLDLQACRELLVPRASLDRWADSDLRGRVVRLDPPVRQVRPALRDRLVIRVLTERPGYLVPLGPLVHRAMLVQLVRREVSENLGRRVSVL